MQCLPFSSFQAGRVDIEIRIGNPSRGEVSDVLHVSINEEETLNFLWLEKEIYSLYYLNFGGKRLKYIKGFTAASGKFMRKEADLWSTCQSQSQFQKPSFTLVQDCPLNHLLSDSHLREITRWIGHSISLLGVLMVVDSRFRRVFSSDKVWTGLNLSFPYFGMGSSGYSKWLVEEAGLPAYNALRVLSISLTSSRLRIWLGNASVVEKSWLDLSFFKRVFGAKVAPLPKQPLVVMVGLPSSSIRQLHKNLQYLLPDSVISASRRISTALLSTDKIVTRERLGNSGHHYRVEVPCSMATQWSRSNSPRDEINDDIDTAAVHVLGDDRLQFISLLHNEQNSHRFRPLLVNAQAIAFCIDIHLLPADTEMQTWRIEDELRVLYDNYCRNSMSHSAENDQLADCINACHVPVVVFASIQDLDYFHDHPAMNLSRAIQAACKIVADVMTSVIQARSKRDALSAKRSWWIQPCTARIKANSEKKCLQYGFIAGINYLLRAIPNS